MMSDLAKRAISCKHWRWLPGMLAGYSDDRPWYRLTEADKYGIPTRCEPPNWRSAWPALTDPATLGCLLAIVRDAHRDAYMSTGNDGPTWVVRDCDGYVVCTGTSERAVLVAALKAAP